MDAVFIVRVACVVRYYAVAGVLEDDASFVVRGTSVIRYCTVY